MKLKNVSVKGRKAGQYVRQNYQARARLINRSARSRLERQDMRWYCLVVAPQGDLLAQRILKDNGFHSFAPLDYRYRKMSKFSKKKLHVVAPAMPGYLFIGMKDGEEDWPTVMDLQPVVGVIGIRGCPVAVKGAEILEFLRSGADRWSVPKEHRFMQSNKEYEVGDSVEIVVGPFSGHVVTVQDIDGDKAHIELKIFGEARDMVVKVDGLAPAR